MMKKNFKKYLLLTLVISLVALPYNASAKTVSDLEKEVAKYTAELQAKKDKIAKNDAEVAEIKKNITKIEGQITEAENEIKRLEDEIDKSNKEIENKKEQSKKIMKYFQIMRSGNTYLEYIFEAESITDMIYRISVVEQLTEYNQNVVKELNQLIIENNTKKQQLKNKQSELSNLKKQLESEKERIDADTANIKVGMPTIEVQIESAKSQVKYYKSLGCGATEDIVSCQVRRMNNSGISLPSTNGWYRPITSGYVTQFKVGGHLGYDIGNYDNPSIEIYPVADGQLIFAGYDSAGALIVVLRHKSGNTFYYSTYAHMSSFSGTVSPYVKSYGASRNGYLTIMDSKGNFNGPIISKDTPIGRMGSTGNSTGPHLHLEIMTCSWRKGGGCSNYGEYTSSSVNPGNLIAFPGRTRLWWYNR